MKFDSSTICVWLAAFIPLVTFVLAINYHHLQKRRAEKAPQSEKLLRPPGFSLSIYLDTIFERIMNRLLFASALAAFASASTFSFLFSIENNAPVFYLGMLFLIALLSVTGCTWVTLRAFHWFKEGRNVRLGISGEQAVAEALNEVAEVGFRFFHDLPATETWNIDHVAVGTRGIFLIETKTRPRRGRRNGQAAHEVIFDGAFLQFPFYKTDEPIEQAKRNAKWLSNYLNKKTGEPVRVEPLVVLPGWYVKFAEKGNPLVKAMNAIYLCGYLRSQAEKIEPSQVRRIVTALDEKCRDVEF